MGEAVCVQWGMGRWETTKPTQASDTQITFGQPASFHILSHLCRSRPTTKKKIIHADIISYLQWTEYDK